MSEWKKVEMADVWDFEEEGKATLTGVFMSVESDVGPNNSKLYTILTDGGEFCVWGSTVLDTRLKNLVLGEEVKIVYTGREKSKTAGRAPYKKFDVFHRQAPMEKVDVKQTAKDMGLDQPPPQEKPPFG